MELKNKSSPRPALLITIDTEGDNLWTQPGEITVENARYLPRFQALCEKFGLKPTWLVNYEMAECPAFVEFARDVLRRNAGEVGMHLHAWNSPPLEPLTSADYFHHPYLIEFPEPMMRIKIARMTDLLEERFERKMLSHRAGRWGLNAVYARLLVERGYRVDCTVTPHLSWAEYPGDPKGAGGPDFTRFPELPYFVDLEQIDRPGESPLLEVPVSIIETRHAGWDRRMQFLPPFLLRISRRFFPPLLQMIPRDNRRSFHRMKTILQQVVRQNRPCATLATHSSELMPGGSPFFPTADSIERLYDRLEILFAAAKDFQGMTLAEFRESRDCGLEK